MKYRYFLPALFILTNTSLYAKKYTLDSALKNTEKKKIPLKRRSENKKESIFIFIDKKPPSVIDESESFEYENKSRFKFKFSPGLGNNNIVGASSAGGHSGSAGSTGGGGSASGGGGHHGGGGKGGRR